MSLTAGPFGMIPTRAVWDRNLPPRHLRILAALAVHAGHNRVCKARQSTIAEELGIAQGTVSKAVTALAQAGYVKIYRSGFPARNVYQVIYDQPDPLASGPGDALVIPPEGITQSPVIPSRGNPSYSNSGNPSYSNMDGMHTNRTYEQNDRQISLAPPAREGGSEEPGAGPFTDFEWLPATPLFQQAITLMPPPATRREVGRWAKALSELHEAGATPHELSRRAAAYLRRWPKATLTITGLSAQWGQLGAEPNAHATATRATEQYTAARSADDEARKAIKRAKFAALSEQIDRRLQGTVPELRR